MLNHTDSVYRLLGDTFIYDEYKGDYVQARAAATRAVEHAAERGSPAELVERLVELALVQTLQGDCVDAQRTCARARQHTGDRGRGALWVTAIEMWATITRWNLYPDGCGSDADETWARWNPQEYAERSGKLWEAAERHVPAGPQRLGPELIYGLLAMLPGSRRMAQDNRSAVDKEWAASTMRGVMHLLGHPHLEGQDARLKPAVTLVAADMAFRTQRHELALKLAASAHAGYERAGDQAGVAACHLANGDFRTGSRFSPLTWHVRLTDSTGTPSIGEIASEVERPSESLLTRAADHYGQAAAGFAAAGAPRGLAAVLLRRGYLAILQQDFATAVHHIAAACDGYARAGDWLAHDLARAHLLLARIGIDPLTTDLATAHDIGGNGLARSVSHALGLGLLIRLIGQRWQATGDVERALAAHRTARALFQGLQVPLNVAQAWTDLGISRSSVGDRHAAACDFDRAMAIFEQESRDRSQLHGNIMSRMVNASTEVYQAYERAADPHGIEWAVTQIERLRPGVFQRSPAVEAAIPALRRATEASLRSVAGLSGTETHDQESAPAAEQLELVHAYLTAWHVQTVIENGNVSARCYRALHALRSGDAGRAAIYFDEALALAGSARAQSKDFLEGVVRAHQRDYDAARLCFERYSADPERATGVVATASGGDERLMRVHERNTLEEKALLALRLRAYDDARRQYAALSERFGSSWWLTTSNPWQSLAAMAETLEHVGEFVGALQVYEAALVAVEARRTALRSAIYRLTVSDEIAVSHVYFDAARAAVKLLEQRLEFAIPEDALPAIAAFAFRNLQANQARILSDLWGEKGFGRRVGNAGIWALTVRQHTWRSLVAHARANGLRATVSSYARHVHEGDDELRRLEAASSGDRTSDVPVTAPSPTSDAGLPDVTAIVDALPPGTAVLQYAFRDELLIAVVAPGSGLRVSRHALGTRDIDPLVQTIHEQRHDAAGGRLAIDRLSGWLLAPVDDVLEAHDHIVVVPDGSMNLLPFHLLTWRGQPLCATHVVVALPSAATGVQLAAATRSPHSGVTVIGNPVNMTFVPAVNGVVLDADPKLTFPVGPLAYAEAEAELVASSFPNAALRCRSAATLAEFVPLASTSRVIHLATHGILVDIAPSLSCILLANGDRLGAEDLARERSLAADLVVLSACQTGAEPVSRGNDALSLARGLLAAGARTVIVTLWAVDDASTTFLMWRFYENCASGLPIAAALGQAQVWLRNLRVNEAREVLSIWMAKPLGTTAHAQIHSLRFDLLARPDDECPYAAPHHWAAFVCIGLPHVSL